jgi:hypothetical protein
MCQEFSQLSILAHPSIAECAVHQNHRPTMTESVECDHCAILREDLSGKPESRRLRNLWGFLCGSLQSN